MADKSAPTGPGGRNRLRGRVAVVVGGGQQHGKTIGNGRAAAIVFAREGARVLVVDRDRSAADSTVEAIVAENGEADAVVGDITVGGTARKILDKAISRFGRVDILHNNVGVVVDEPTEELELAQWERGLALNLTGTWALCREFLPVLREQASGVITNISSLASILPGATAYAVGKNGVNALTRGLALEYAPFGVRVNAIVPGIIDTPIGVDRVAISTGGDREEIARRRADTVPMGRQGTAWDIASAAAFLVSDEASYITGVVLAVDGGAGLRQAAFG